MPIKQVLYRRDQKVPVKIWTDDIDYESQNQLANIAQLPFIFKHIAAMPDVHLGKGATVGSVIATKGAIIPAAVGVDLGCGINAVRLSTKADQLPDSLTKLRYQIEKDIPLGAGASHKMDKPMSKGMNNSYEKIFDKIKFGPSEFKKALTQLGTLGSGNHFIEICLDQEDHVWVMLHSGSRGIGNMIGSHYIGLARKEMEKMFITLPDKDLAYLVENSSVFNDYIEAVHWAQDYALENRRLMMKSVLDNLKKFIPEFSIIHEGANCFAGETKVITYGGTYEIKNLIHGNHKLLTLNGNWVDAEIKSFGQQQLFKLTLTRSGTEKIIYTTFDHGWIVAPIQRKFTLEKKTIELQPGDRLASILGKKVSWYNNPEAIARGFVFGDGSLYRNKSRASFCGKKIDFMLDIFIDNKFGLPPRYYKNTVVINSLPGEWKSSLPDLNCDPSYLYSWLSGYFAADGDVTATGKPTISSKSYENLQYVRNICEILGIGTFGIRGYMHQGYGDNPTMMYRLGFMRQNLNKYFFQNPEHYDRFEKTTKKITDRITWKVKSVEATDRFEEVYCAIVEETHCFALEDNILTRNCHHNYIAIENHYNTNVYLTRKGAIRAREGDIGIIPGSMGDKSYVVRGKGDHESFCSCSHGAGRRLSRTQAKNQFTIDDLEVQTQGIECRKDSGVIDEIPQAYKPIDEVMENQSDLVEVLFTLKQVLNVKG